MIFVVQGLRKFYCPCIFVNKGFGVAKRTWCSVLRIKGKERKSRFRGFGKVFL